MRDFCGNARSSLPGWPIRVDLKSLFSCSESSFPGLSLCWGHWSIYRVTHTHRLHLKSIPMIMLSILLGPLGNVMLGKGMKGIGSVSLNNFRDLLGIAA